MKPDEKVNIMADYSIENVHGVQEILVIVSFHKKKFNNQQYSAKLFWQMMIKP